MIIPIIAGIAYLSVGLVRTQRATVDKVLHPKAITTSKNEPIWHAAFWPVGFFVSGK